MKCTRYLQWPLIVILFLTLSGYENIPEPTVEEAPARPLIWHDLVTPDLDASKKFYESVFGWTFKDVKVKGLRLAGIYSGATRIGGVIEVPRANQAVWVKLIPVNDLEQRVDMVKQSGGRVILPPAKIPGRGTQVVLEGAEGEEFAFIGNIDPAFGGGGMADKHPLAWSELWADDPAKSKSFYETAFGVATNDQEVDGRPYWVFENNGEKIAGMIENPITNQGTQWVPYVLVSDPSGVVERAEQGGAFIVLEPAEDIRDGKFGIFQDPAGAIVCVQKK